MMERRTRTTSLTALGVSVMLAACGGGGGGNADPIAAADTPSTGPASGAATTVDDGPFDVTLDGDTDDLSVNDLGGVTGSANGASIDIVVAEGAVLSDELITEGLLRARGTIVGEWGLLEPGTQCLSTIRFDDRERFVQTSLDEVRSGEYEVYLDEPDDATLSLLLLYDEDNRLPDCRGDNSSSAGSLFDVYLSFPSPDRMRFSEAPGGLGNSVELDRRN